MRVMFWSPVFWPSIGGVQTVASELLAALGDRGYEFIVVTDRHAPELPAEEEHRGIPIRRFPFAASLRDVKRLAHVRGEVIRLRKAFGPELCHAATLGPTDFFQHVTAHTPRTPLLVSVFGEWPSTYDRLLGNTLRSADWVVCDSQDTLHYACRLAPETAEGSSVIRTALPPPSVPPSPLPFDPPRLVYLGRLASEKGPDLAVAALSMVTRRHPDAHLVLAGDGPQRDALEQLAVKLGLEKAVRFLGWVNPEDVPALLNTASLLLLPSRADSFPLAGLQASLMGRPIVAARVGGIPEMVVDRKTGLLVERENSGALAEAVCHLLDHPIDAMRMGREARARILGELRHGDYVDAYDRLYRRIAARRPCRGDPGVQRR